MAKTEIAVKLVDPTTVYRSLEAGIYIKNGNVVTVPVSKAITSAIAAGVLVEVVEKDVKNKEQAEQEAKIVSLKSFLDEASKLLAAEQEELKKLPKGDVKIAEAEASVAIQLKAVEELTAKVATEEEVLKSLVK
jgi:uncharacterized coiled-coil protein SlyX